MVGKYKAKRTLVRPRHRLQFSKQFLMKQNYIT